MNGYHSIDLAYNGIQRDYAHDQTISGKILSIQDVYTNGLKQLFISIILIMYSSYNIGKENARTINKNK